MSLAPGFRLGVYEVTSALGAGGMGEVYRARDTRLHRDVALKILPDSFSADSDRLARFEGEAQVLALVEGVIVSAKNEVVISSGLRARLILLAPPTDGP